MQSKNGLQNLWEDIVFLILCKGIRCHMFIKIISLYNSIHFLAILYPTSLANLVVEVGTKHGHQMLLQWKHTGSSESYVVLERYTLTIT